METIATWTAIIVGVSAAAGALYAAYRKVRRGLRAFTAKVSGASDALLGREEIRHPDTGEVLVEATPNLGHRLARIEGAVVSLADTSTAVVSLSRRVDDLSTTLHTHITDSNVREGARTEEQTEMWKAIRAVAQATPEEK